MNEIDPDAEEMAFSVFTDTSSMTKNYYNGDGSKISYWFRSPSIDSSNFFVAEFGSYVYTRLANYINVAISFVFCM